MKNIHDDLSSLGTHTHTHTHTFNSPFSGTTRVSRYQKGKTNLDFTEARDSEWQWHPLGHMQVCTTLQLDNHASTPPVSFLQAGCPSCRPTNSVKALKANECGSQNRNKFHDFFTAFDYRDNNIFIPFSFPIEGIHIRILAEIPCDTRELFACDTKQSVWPTCSQQKRFLIKVNGEDCIPYSHLGAQVEFSTGLGQPRPAHNKWPK